MNEFSDPILPIQPSTPDQRMEKLNIKVLVADDDEDVLEISTRMLKRMDYTVETVKNGKELIERLANAKPGEFSLVITDNTMPIMTGIEALKQIRADERFKDLPIILNSGDHGIEEIVKNIGGLYLKKPYGLKDFRAIVEEALAKSKS